jgi:radical SAM superfamily enzyme YgiQ (UPF0313 family)
MSLVPPSIGLFSSLLKERGVKVDLFDTSDYKISDMDSDMINEKILTVHPVEVEHQIEFKKTDAYEDFNKKIERFKPDLIAATTTESTFLLMIKLLKSVRHHNILTILGGVFATFVPELALKYPEIDLVCRGEGERPLVELCERLSRKESYLDVPNLYIKKKDGSIVKNKMGPIVDINKNPPLDFSIFDEKRLYRMMGGKIYRMLPVETHRGCPYMCGYCGSPQQNKLFWEETHSKFFRKKSISRVGKIVSYYQKKWKAEYFFFWADTFFSYTNEEIDEFCEMYKDIKIPFYAQARPETINEYKIKKLKEVGLNRVGVGIEHGNEKFRKEVLKRYYTNQQAIDAMSIVRKYGISFSLNNIIGLPDETPELAMDTVELNRQIKGFEDASCSIFQPYHGTPLRELSIKRGYMKPDVIASHNADVSILNMPQFPKEKILGLQRTFSMYIRFPKDRWDEIRLAEKFTPEGNAMWEKLRDELIKTYF